MQSRQIGSSTARVLIIALAFAGIYIVASDLAMPRWMLLIRVALSIFGVWFCYRYIRSRADIVAYVARTAAIRMAPANEIRGPDDPVGGHQFPGIDKAHLTSRPWMKPVLCARWHGFGPGCRVEFSTEIRVSDLHS